MNDRGYGSARMRQASYVSDRVRRAQWRTYLTFDIGGTKVASGLVTLPDEPAYAMGGGRAVQGEASYRGHSAFSPAWGGTPRGGDAYAARGETPPSARGIRSAASFPPPPPHAENPARDASSAHVTPLVQDVRSMPTCPELGGDSLRERLIALAAERLAECRDAGRPVEGIGIAAAGVPDSESGVILSATDILPGWQGQRIYEAFARITELPVRMIGDVGAHGLGEAVYGAGRGADIVLSIGVGTGLGGALVIGGRLMTGAHGVAGHAGHVACGLGRGMRCSCGTAGGHLEPVASGSGLAALYNAGGPWAQGDSRMPQGAGDASPRSVVPEPGAGETLRRGAMPEQGVGKPLQQGAMPEQGVGAVLRGVVPERPVSNGRDVCDRAAAGEPYALSVLRASGRALGECVAGMANLLDPGVIVLSGSVVNAGEPWWDAVRAGFEDGALPLVRPTPLVRGALGGDAPLIGAAHAAHLHHCCGC